MAISENLRNVEKWYASQYGLSLPLTAEQVVNAVVEWLGVFGDDYTIKEVTTGAPYVAGDDTITPINIVMGNGDVFTFNITSKNGAQGARGETGERGATIASMNAYEYAVEGNYTITRVAVHMSDGEVRSFAIRAANGTGGGGVQVTPVIQDTDICYAQRVDYLDGTAVVHYQTQHGKFTLNVPIEGGTGVVVGVNEGQTAITAKLDMRSAQPTTYLYTPNGTDITWRTGIESVPYVVIPSGGGFARITDEQYNTLITNMDAYIYYNGRNYRRCSEDGVNLWYSCVYNAADTTSSDVDAERLGRVTYLIIPMEKLETWTDRIVYQYTIKLREPKPTVYLIGSSGTLSTTEYNYLTATDDPVIQLGTGTYRRVVENDSHIYFATTCRGSSAIFNRTIDISKANLYWTNREYVISPRLYRHLVHFSYSAALTTQHGYAEIITSSNTALTEGTFASWLQTHSSAPCTGYVDGNSMYRVKHDGSKFTFYYGKGSSTDHSSLSTFSDTVYEIS